MYLEKFSGSWIVLHNKSSSIWCAEHLYLSSPKPSEHIIFQAADTFWLSWIGSYFAVEGSEVQHSIVGILWNQKDLASNLGYFRGLFGASHLNSRHLRFPICAKGIIISNSEIAVKTNVTTNVQCLIQARLMTILSYCLPQGDG